VSRQGSRNPGSLEIGPAPGGGLSLSVRVVPRAARDAIAGVRDGALLVRLTAPPVEGRANAALIRLLASALGVPRSAIGIAAGASGRTKRLTLTGTTAEAVTALAAGPAA